MQSLLALSSSSSSSLPTRLSHEVTHLFPLLFTAQVRPELHLVRTQEMLVLFRLSVAGLLIQLSAELVERKKRATTGGLQENPRR